MTDRGDNRTDHGDNRREIDDQYPLGQLVSEFSQLKAVVGREPDGNGDEGTGLARMCHRTAAIIGEAPNDATGDEGTGLCRQVATLVRAESTRSRNITTAVVAGVTASVGLIEAVQLIARLLH